MRSGRLPSRAATGRRRCAPRTGTARSSAARRRAVKAPITAGTSSTSSSHTAAPPFIPSAGSSSSSSASIVARVAADGAELRDARVESRLQLLQLVRCGNGVRTAHHRAVEGPRAPHRKGTGRLAAPPARVVVLRGNVFEHFERSAAADFERGAVCCGGGEALDKR